MAIPETEKTGPGQGAAAPVETGKPVPENRNVASGVSAKASVPKFGGLKGGRKRDDGLTPGSAEAAEADREKDAKRKREERAAAAVAVASSQPLPAKLSPVQSELPAQTGSPAAGVVAPSAAPPVVPWTAEIVKPFTSELIPVVEAVRVAKRTEKATAAGLSKDLIKEIQKDAHWPAVAKKTLDTSLPRLSAKWLNKSGMSAEYADEVAVGSALLMIWRADTAITERLDKLIELKEKQLKQNEKTRDAGVSYAGVPMPDPKAPKGAPPTIT